MAWKYAFQKKYESERMARASATYLPVSYKHSREICEFLKGKKLLYAMTYLKGVINLRWPIPFKRYVRDVGHKKGMASGRYPVKASKYLLNLFENALANANAKGLDEERLFVLHLVTHHAVAHQKRRGKLAHVEIVVEEREDEKRGGETKKKSVKINESVKGEFESSRPEGGKTDGKTVKPDKTVVKKPVKASDEIIKGMSEELSEVNKL